MTRILSSAFVLVCIAGSFAHAATEVVLWHSYRADEKKALEQVVAKFNAESADVKVKLLPIPYDAFADKITAAVPLGKGPDLFIFANNQVGDWAEAGILEPVEFFADEALLEQYFSPTVDALVYKQRLYGLPLAFKSTALVYNKALIKSAPKTTDELIAVAEKLTDRAAGRYGLVYENSDFYFHAPWFFGFGGTVLGADGKPHLVTDGAAASMVFARDLARRALPEEVTSAVVSTLFNEGKAAMVINGPWFFGEIKQGLKYGVALLPTVSATGKQAAPFLGSEALMLSAKSAHKKEAFAAMRFLAGSESAATRLSVGHQTVANVAAYDSAAGREFAMATLRAQMERATPMPNLPAMRHVWGPMNSALTSVLTQGVDPKAALVTAQQRVESSIQKSGR